MIYKSKEKIDIFIIGCSAFRVTNYNFINYLENKHNIFLLHLIKH